MDDLTLRRHIRRQRETIDLLASSGLDTTEAENLLRVYEKLHVLHVAHRDRVRDLDERIRSFATGEPGAA